MIDRHVIDCRYEEPLLLSKHCKRAETVQDPSPHVSFVSSLVLRVQAKGSVPWIANHRPRYRKEPTAENVITYILYSE